jgi:hypothetical protein
MIAYSECLNAWLTDWSSCGNLTFISLKGITEPESSMSNFVILTLFPSILFTFAYIYLFPIISHSIVWRAFLLEFKISYQVVCIFSTHPGIQQV